MHIGEALLPREDAVRMAAQELQRVVDRNGKYYDKVPHMRPDPARPMVNSIRMDDTWFFIPFARGRADAEPLYVRVNGVTKVVVIDRSF
jgi:hypothetical protein